MIYRSVCYTYSNKLSLCHVDRILSNWLHRLPQCYTAPIRYMCFVL